ncbi:MAG TPA: hypothetical protein ENK06_09680, partial [Gammaproteobacteria bacterium]|nr:hypothetical protein [Gammaproteobacteria bacterium]
MRKSEVATPKSSEARWLKHQQQVDAINSRAKIQNKNETNLTQLKKSFNVKNRMSLGADPQHLAGRKFSFDTEDTDIQIALREFASKYKLNMFIDQDIEGSISVDFKNLPLKKAMTLLLGSHNYFWSWDNGLIRISRLQTKTFVIDYLRLTRSGQAATNSSISIETVR